MKYIKSYLKFLGVIISVGLAMVGLMLMTFSMFFDSFGLKEILLHTLVFLIGSLIAWSSKELLKFSLDF